MKTIYFIAAISALTLVACKKENLEVKDHKDVQKFLKESLKITEIHIKRINDYLEVNDWTIDFEEIKEKLLEKINEVESSDDELDKKELKRVSFDPGDPEDIESLNVHYVAVTRPKNELYFMIYDSDKLD